MEANVSGPSQLHRLRNGTPPQLRGLRIGHVVGLQPCPQNETPMLKLGLQGVKWVEKLFYRIPISVLQDDVKYDSFVIGSDEDLEVLFHCHRLFSEVRTPELLAKLVDVFSSSGGSNQNTQTLATTTCSSSRPVGGSSSVPVIAPQKMVVASPSFAVDLNRSGDREVGIIDRTPVSLQRWTPDSIDDILPDDDDVDDVEPDIIADDSGDDIAASNSARAGRASSSGTQQYPPHFLSLDLDVMKPEGVPDEPIRFDARDTQGTRGLSEFQFKVVESDYRKYLGKCIEFDNGCTWLIRISLRQRRGVWEVKQYNGPHTCLAMSISNDHRSLDYHVISAFIPPMVRADAAVCIKMMMPGSVAVLRTSPVRVGGQVDGSQAYFHRLFWTFPPCIEAFRHCKSLVNIDGTHLYSKYGDMLLVAIAQDGNSNILPIAFSLVEGENAESWMFFLSQLRQHVTPQPGILVISDRHNGIKAALEAPNGGWLPPVAYRAFCIRHMAANFALTFKGKDAQRLLVNAAYAKTEVEFDYWFDILRIEDPAMCEWANRIEYAMWTQHRVEGRRFGHMTTNISESVNSILRGVKNLPFCSLVKATYGRLAELFVQRCHGPP
ncbi:uncharacterized protein LOC107636747 [Arachis ipaensis]|uniref:uncharacterized protein LOC107636747 n=1 Tax=Arachis ipaensis TaxID=130454 RepID=UPI0007AF7A74|nr:uncharacterized protein LOC107636747 [Arachis ipaensis]